MCKFRLVMVLILVFGLTGIGICEEIDYTQYDYGVVSKDVSDISWYKGPEDTSSYEQTWALPGFGKARNVIFLIGDGMSTAQVKLARLKAVGAYGKLYMEKLPVTGLVKTHSANAHVTDSAAAGTALACGIKTNNGMLGMNPEKKRYQSLLGAAQELGKRTGLLATSTISHATPASFSSHVENRGMEPEIAAQIVEHDINVILGGGKKHWVKESRKDGRDLMSEAKGKGYEIVNNADEMKAAQGKYVLGLFQDDALSTFSPEPSIGEMTKKAIELLSRKDKKHGWADQINIFKQDKGFFMMVEGSQIDWACHGNDANNCIKQTLLFDLAVREAVEFAKEDKHTLVVVSADHETGGLTVFGGDPSENNPQPKWSSGGHSAAEVPVYAFGPGAEAFTGLMDNIELSKKIAEAMGVKEYPKALD